MRQRHLPGADPAAQALQLAVTDVYLDGRSDRARGPCLKLRADVTEAERLVTTETLPAVQSRVTDTAGHHTLVLSAAVYLLMRVWASWATATELSGSRMTTVVSVTRNYRAELVPHDG